MKRKTFLLLFLVLTFLLLGYFCFIKNYSFFDYENNSNEDYRVLIDSLKLQNAQTLYWFKYEAGLSTNTESFIAISNRICDISNKNALVRGDLIKGIDTVKNDSIFIVSMDSLAILNASSEYKFIKSTFSYDRKYLRKNVPKEIYISAICNNKKINRL